jgi:multiple sugar transport system ATP-binding protein
VANIELEQVTKVYPNGVRAVDAVDLEIGDGEFMVLVGPSGCGKTTLLRMIAGLEEVSGGRVRIGGRDVTMLAPRRRDIAMVFQNYALYPHMTVAENLGFGLRLQKVDRAERRRRVADVAAILGLDTMLDRKPAALSGGQRQRVAMGRAMVREPQAYLMDEPLSNLDAKLRVAMRAQLLLLHERLGVTTVYVTHDQVEAMTLGQRVAVMRDGVLQQCDSPQTLYRRPLNLFVAAFIGSPAMNLVEATIEDGTVSFAGHEVALPDATAPNGAGPRLILGIRPSDFELAGPSTDPDLPRMRVKAELVEDLGDERYLIFPLEARPVTTDETRAAAEGEETAKLIADDRTLFNARVDSRRPVQAGETVELALDHRRLHFFDPATGDAIRAAAG